MAQTVLEGRMSAQEERAAGFGDRGWDQLPVRPLPCPHRHFAASTVSRDQLAPHEYLALLSTPRGYRWMQAPATVPGQKCYPVAAKTARRNRKRLVRPPEQQHASEFLSEVLRLLSSQSTRKILVEEFGLSNEEAETITKEQKGKKKTVSVINQDVRATWLKEYKRLMRAKLTDYVVNIMSSRRSKRTRYIASTFLKHFSDLTGEHCNLNNPRNRVQRIQVYVADRLASWLANIMAETDKEMCKNYLEKSVNEFDSEPEEEPQHKPSPRPRGSSKKKLEDEKRKKQLEEEKRKKLEEQRKRELEKKKLDDEKKKKLREQKQKALDKRQQDEQRRKEEAARKMKEMEEKKKLDEEKKNAEREQKRKAEEERKKREEERLQKRKEGEEKRKREEEERKKRLEENKKKNEEQRKKAEEERIRKEEERRKREDEERKKREDEARKKQEEKKRLEEEKRKKEEEDRLKEQKRKEGEKNKKEEQLKKDREEKEKRKMEDEEKKKEEERKKMEEDQRKKEEEEQRKRKEEEDRKKKEEERKKKEEERKKKEEEKKKKGEKEVHHGDEILKGSEPEEGAGDILPPSDPLDKVSDWVQKVDYEETPAQTEVANILEDEILEEIGGRVSIDEEKVIIDSSKAYANWITHQIETAKEEMKFKKTGLSKVTYHITKAEGRCYYDVKKIDEIKVCDMTKAARYEKIAVMSESLCKRPENLGELKTSKDMKEWAQWAANVVDLAEKWASWIDQTCSEAEAEASSSEQKEGQDWGKFKRSAESRALELRRIKKYIKETANMWNEKFKGNF